jgi:hypothetical protein
MAIHIKTTNRGVSIRATGSSDCRGVLEAMGFSLGGGQMAPVEETPVSPEALHKAMTSRKALANPQIAVAAWNNAVSVGQWVDYREVEDAAPQRLRTRTRAEVLSGHTAVVWLEGKSGCVCCTHCTPVEAPLPTCELKGVLPSQRLCPAFVVGTPFCGTDGECEYQKGGVL